MSLTVAVLYRMQELLLESQSTAWQPGLLAQASIQDPKSPLDWPSKSATVVSSEKLQTILKVPPMFESAQLPKIILLGTYSL